MPNLYDLARQFRSELIAGEERAADALVSRYGNAWRTIKGQLDQLLAQIEQERAAGKTVSGAWLRRQERYERLLADAEREVGEFARYASQAVQQQQQAAIVAGLNSAPQLAAASANVPSVLVNWNRLPTEAFRELVGFTADGTPLSKLLGSLGPRASRSISSELLSGLAQGKGIRHVARQIEGDLGGDLVRARLIARTETLRAYRESSIRSYAANPRVCRKWRWTASRSRRTCAMCLAMDGREFPLDVPFGSHPQCRCVATPVTVSAAELLDDPTLPDLRPQRATGPEWFAKQSPDLQEAVLGKSKFALYRDGELELKQLVAYRDDPDWGPTRWERSLKSIRGE